MKVKLTKGRSELTVYRMQGASLVPHFVCQNKSLKLTTYIFYFIQECFSSDMKTFHVPNVAVKNTDRHSYTNACNNPRV